MKNKLYIRFYKNNHPLNQDHIIEENIAISAIWRMIRDKDKRIVFPKDYDYLEVRYDET